MNHDITYLTRVALLGAVYLRKRDKIAMRKLKRLLLLEGEAETAGEAATQQR